jgi:hypothetical protein
MRSWQGRRSVKKEEKARSFGFEPELKEVDKGKLKIQP